MAGDGPLAPPSLFHRTNGSLSSRSLCGPDDCRCTDGIERGWYLAYPGAKSDDRACVHFACPWNRCLQEKP